MTGYQQFRESLEQKGFQLLGYGLFSRVYAHPKRRDIAVKLSEGIDQWPDYVTWATINGYAGSFAPKVFSLKFYDGFYVSVMERLVDTISGIRHEYSERSGNYRNPVNPFEGVDGYSLRGSDNVELAAFAKDMYASGFSGDLHDGNVMVRHDGGIVVTDPSSARTSTSPRIRRGQVV